MLLLNQSKKWKRGSGKGTDILIFEKRVGSSQSVRQAAVSQTDLFRQFVSINLQPPAYQLHPAMLQQSGSRLGVEALRDISAWSAPQSSKS